MDNFYSTELQKALREQEFGIVTSRIDEEASKDNSALAIIHLLEQREIRVKLSNGGYEIISEAKVDAEHILPRVFETLDDLLFAVSPTYGERRTEEFMSRLSQLANTLSSS